MTELTNNNLNDFTKNGIVVVDVWSPTCTPCIQLMPILEELELELKDSVSFGKLNGREYGDIAAELNIRSVPTLLFYNNGVLKSQVSGFKTSDNIKEILNTIQ